MNNEQNPIEETQDIRFKEPTFIDPLTGLFNQYYLYQFLPEELKKAKLGNYPVSVLMIDLDGFKGINDTYGHLYGDEVLKQLAQVLKKSVRQTDMVIRYAGDEFVILLPAVDLKRVEILSNQFIENIDKNAFQGKEGQAIHITISIGFAIYPYDSEQMDELIDLADKALYLSKQKGKNRVSHAKEVTLEAASYIIAMDSFPCPEFIDREEQMDRLERIFDTFVLKSHLLQVTFISGGSGVGKTRLLAELKNYIQDQAAVISCNSSYVHVQDPYYLFAKGISDYIDKIGIDSSQIYSLFSRISPLELVQLSRIIPAIAKLLKGPVDSEPEDKKARFLLFKAFLDFLFELNKASAILISFDDIHWADKGSLELIRYLSKQEKNKRIFIVCSFSEPDNNLKELLEYIRFDDNFTQIELKNLSLEDTSKMVEAIFPGLEATKEFYGMIYNTTVGNPSFIEEVFKLLIENAVIFYQDKRWQIKKDFSIQDIPTSMDELIKKRLRNLDEETKEMIVQAAVVGENFSVDFLKKIGAKDEGFVLELLDRAKKMRLIDRLDTKGNFSFLNKDVQNILYHHELDEQRRSQLHYKIGQTIAQEYKDNLYKVAGEAAFHFSKAPLQEEAQEYSKMLEEKINHIFIPTEAMGYLTSLAKQVIEKEEVAVPAPLSDKMSKEAVKLIGLLQRAIKNFHLYPPGIMRINAVGEAYSSLNMILSETECLNLGEVEKGLVINNKRVLPRGIDYANAEYFLNLMIQNNLKAISFTKRVSQDELDRFIQYLSQSPDNIIKEGGWAQIIDNEEINGIKIDEVRFIQVGGVTGEFEERKKIEDAMLMEFLIGKIGHSDVDTKALIHNMRKDPKRFAQTIMEASQEMLKEGKHEDEAKTINNSIEKINSQILDKGIEDKDRIRDLAKVILELKPGLRNKVIRSRYLDNESIQKEEQENVINAIPDEVIVDMIIEEYKENQGNLLAIKDFIDKLLADTERKKNILSELEAELLKLNVSDQEITFITERQNWEDLPIDKRIDNLIKLPDKYYKSELGKIKALLGELDSKQNMQELENFLSLLINKTEHPSTKTRKDLMGIITDFTKISDRKGALGVEDKSAGLLKNLDTEINPSVLAAKLEIFREIIKEFTVRQSSRNIILEIEKPQTKGYFIFIQRLFNTLLNRLKLEKSRDLKIYKLIEDFIRDISYGDFLEILVYIIINESFQEKIDLKDIFPIVGERLIDTIINIENKKTTILFDAYREFIIKKRLVNLLQELGEPALDILQQRLFQMKEDMPISLIELIGYFNKEEWLDLLIPSINHKDPSIRRAATVAIGNINGKKGMEILSLILKKEKDKRIRTLANKELVRLKNRK